MKRMAVSSVGLIEASLGICLENGLLLDARAVIVTAPARYAEHMLRTLAPDAALLLVDYRYDPVVRVSLGYRGRRARTARQPAAQIPATVRDAGASPGRTR
ncbi:MAG: hypothetical protein U0521_16770 [Anaerolineae bacterium]